ncbi:hypothetical protein LCGC14_2099500 [marine sediment metagenome]|uniref:Uncharacterized protein n=1 Tax=marine sediment metagenome TaxID=412755 RepID=A0A0F9EAL5_9ZZZZ
MTQGNGKPNALIEAYLQMTQQEAGEQELGGPRAPPYVQPDDGQNRHQPQPSESFPVTLPRPAPEAIDVESIGGPPPLRGADAQPAQGPLPPPILAQTPDVGTPESISLEARPGILEGMEYSSDIRVEPGRDSGEVRLEGYENARGGTRERSRWKDPSTYLGIADRLAAGWAAPGPGGGFGEGWALTAGDERTQQQEAARAPYENRQLEAETRKTEADAQLAGYQADVFTEQAQFKREQDEVRLEYNKALTRNMEQVTRRSAQQMGIEAGQLPMKQAEALARVAKLMTEEEMIQKRMQAMGREMTPRERDKLDAEIDAIKALGEQREASASLSGYRERVDLPRGRELQGRERQAAPPRAVHPSRIINDLQKVLTEIYNRHSDAGGRIIEENKDDYAKEIEEAKALYGPMETQSRGAYGIPEPAGNARPTGFAARQEAAATMNKRSVR